MEFSVYCKEQFTNEVVTAIHSFMTQHYATLSLSHGQKLMEALSLVTSAIDKPNFATNFHQVNSLPLQTLTSANQQTNREEILKALTLMAASTKAVDDCPATELLPVLLPLFQLAWPGICQILSTRSNDTQLIEASCEYLIRMARALKSELAEHFILI